MCLCVFVCVCLCVHVFVCESVFACMYLCVCVCMQKKSTYVFFNTGVNVLHASDSSLPAGYDGPQYFLRKPIKISQLEDVLQAALHDTGVVGGGGSGGVECAKGNTPPPLKGGEGG